MLPGISIMVNRSMKSSQGPRVAFSEATVQLSQKKGEVSSSACLRLDLHHKYARGTMRAF